MAGKDLKGNSPGLEITPVFEMNDNSTMAEAIEKVREFMGDGAANMCRASVTDRNQEVFAQEWGENRLILRDSGFYDAVADFIGIGVGPVYADLGAGMADLADIMIERNPGTTVYALEINPYILREAKGIERCAPVVCETDSGFPANGAINLVMDDARRPKKLAEILNRTGEYIDLATIVLPGADYHDIEDSDCLSLVQKVIVGTRDLLAPGGKLVVVGRFYENAEKVALRHAAADNGMYVTDHVDCSHIVSKYLDALGSRTFSTFGPSLSHKRGNKREYLNFLRLVKG